MPPRGYPFPGGAGFPGSGRGRGAQHDPYRQQQLLRVALVLLQQIATMERKPPVTLLLCLVNVLCYLRPSGFDFVPSLQQGCLHPARILKSWQWWRLLWSPLLHADEVHLFYNLSSLLWKGGQLEPRMGSPAFLRLIVELALVSNALYVGLALGLATYYPPLGRSIMQQCAVGFSGVLFGLKVVLSHDSPGWSDVYGVRLPTKYVCWAELVLAQLMVPGASFWGHLCGILAGILHVRLLGRIGPFAPGRAGRGTAGGGRGRGGGGLDGLWRALFGAASRGRPRTYGRGTWGGGNGAGGPAYAGQAPHGLSGAGLTAATLGGEPAFGRPRGEAGNRGGWKGGGSGDGWGGTAEQPGPRAGSRSSGSRAADGDPDSVLGPNRGSRSGGRGAASERAGSRSRHGGANGGRLSGLGTAAAVAAYAVLAAAWVLNPGLDDFLRWARQELSAHSGGGGSLPGAVQQALLWAQAKTGLGVALYNLHLFSLVCINERWFLGAFGAWAPVHPAAGTALGVVTAGAEWAAYAVRRAAGEDWRALRGLLGHPPPGVLLLQACMGVVFVAWYLLPPGLALSYLEVGPAWGLGGGGGRARLGGALLNALLAGLSHDQLLHLARSLLFVALAGGLVEDAVGPEQMVLTFLATGAAGHATASLVGRLLPGGRERRRLFGRKGAEPGVYALMFLALAQQARATLAASHASQSALLSWLAQLAPAGRLLGQGWGALAWPGVSRMLSMASRGLEPTGPSPVLVAVMWLALERLLSVRLPPGRRHPPAAPAGGRDRSGGPARGRGIAVPLWWAAALVLRALAALAQLAVGLLLAPLRVQLAALRFAGRWASTLAYLLLLVVLLVADASLATLQQALPSAQQQLPFSLVQLGCTATAAALLAASLARHLWRAL